MHYTVYMYCCLYTAHECVCAEGRKKCTKAREKGYQERTSQVALGWRIIIFVVAAAAVGCYRLLSLSLWQRIKTCSAVLNAL